jgi:hypothetical protein
MSRAIAAIRGTSISGNALGVVAHPLQVGDDVQHRRDRSQVARHRLLGGDQRQRALLDLEALAIDQRVVGDHPLRSGTVALIQRYHRTIDRLVHHAGQQQKLFLQRVELRVEVCPGAARNHAVSIGALRAPHARPTSGFTIPAAPLLPAAVAHHGCAGQGS